jgi:hypothetical protein
VWIDGQVWMVFHLKQCEGLFNMFTKSWIILGLMHPQTPRKTQMRIWRWKQWKRNGDMLFNSLHFRGIGLCWSSEMGAQMSDEWVNYSHGPTQTKQQVG